MARKRRSYRRSGGRKRSRRSRGLLGGLKLMDASQGLYNGYKLGYVDAAKLAMAGDFENAALAVITPAASPDVMVTTALGNLFIGVNRKLIRATGGKFVRRYIA